MILPISGCASISVSMHTMHSNLSKNIIACCHLPLHCGHVLYSMYHDPFTVGRTPSELLIQYILNVEMGETSEVTKKDKRH